MANEPLDIRYVEFEDGAIPYLKWFRKQSAEVKSEIDARLIQVRKRNFGDHRRLKRGVIELRFDFGQGLRVYGGEWQGLFFLLLHGGFKPTQQADIAEATRLWVAFTKSAGKKKKKK
ncbi:MAG: type II toxin-antitoxin system RelE/ParE family toxin [bacterium]